MCLILLAYRVHPEFPLIVVANRDEFYARPTAVASIWPEPGGILAGRDLQAQGTWLGVTGSGKFAAITNYRSDEKPVATGTSRGDLVAGYLRSSKNAQCWSSELIDSSDEYQGYNLLTFDGEHLVYASNRGSERLQSLTPGIHGLSNKHLNTPWPKVRQGCEALQSLVNEDAVSTGQLIDLMADNQQAPDNQLPDTGVSLQWERLLSSTFIHSEYYGTRCTTVVKFSVEKNIEFIERTYRDDGRQLITNQFQFKISPCLV